MAAVIITGAGSGIGRATARVFARKGWSVLCADLVADAAQKTAASIGDQARSFVLDVLDEDGCDRAVAAAVELGELSAVVTCAGANGRARADEMSRDMFEHIMGVNVTGSFLIARAAGRVMIEQGTRGAVTLISSINGVHALAGQAAYATSKGAVLMLAKVLAVDWGPFGIRVNSIGPGLTDTPMAAGMLADEKKMRWAMDRIPLKRVADPEDIGEVIHFLSSDSARHVTGVFVPVDGGWLTGA
ncbi:MAG: SDR family oxidoreductase [Acidimicrobiia bacterium]|nr:SDR family oxidoreductase [Acidimicrobiia bacterium]MYD04942.1 SDR family oxidoreductase [Acidimicrobiia bacterium]